MGIWVVLAMVGAGGVGCADPSDHGCREAVRAVQACGIDLDVLDCGPPEWDCKYRCYGDLSCDQLHAWFDGGPGTRALRVCFDACGALSCGDGTTFSDWTRCDGVLDCADGRDESGCTYLMCPDGQLVHLEYGYCPPDGGEPPLPPDAAADGDGGVPPLPSRDAGDESDGG